MFTWLASKLSPKPSTHAIVAFYGDAIYLASMAAASSAVGDGERVSVDKGAALTREFMHVLLNLVDRRLFARLSVQRASVMDEICLLTHARLVEAKAWPAEIEARMSAEVEEYNKASEFYGSFKELVPKSKQGPKGTLFWEFGKRFAAICGAGMDIGYITVGMQLLSSAYQELVASGKRHRMP